MRALLARAALAGAASFAGVVGLGAPTVAPRPAGPGLGLPIGSVYGVLTAGPTCPVERPGHKCVRAVAATIDARDSGGGTAGSARSSATGRYRLNLRPGHYTLVVVIHSIFPPCPATPVTVRAVRATRANIACDTGIR